MSQLKPIHKDAIARAFETVKALDMAEGYDAFIQQYPGTLYAKLAAQLKAKLGTKPAEGPKTEPEAEKTTVKTAAAIADLKGRWSGAVVCRNGGNFSVDMTILTQSGKSAKGEVHWTGSNTGRDTVSVAPNPAAETPDGYLIVTSNPQAYDYFVTLEGNVLRGQSTGSERCSVTLER